MMCLDNFSTFSLYYETKKVENHRHGGLKEGGKGVGQKEGTTGVGKRAYQAQEGGRFSGDETC